VELLSALRRGQRPRLCLFFLRQRSYITVLSPVFGSLAPYTGHHWNSRGLNASLFEPANAL
jgi:hypothetical protein